MVLMQGLTLASIKRNKALIPLFLCVTVGCVGALGYGLRMALYSPDVAWRNKQQPGFSNEFYRDKQYKFYSPTIDYSTLQQPPTY